MTTIRTQRFTVKATWNDGSTSQQGPFDLARASDVRRSLERHADLASVELIDELVDLAKNVGAFDDRILASANVNLLRATLLEFRTDARAVLSMIGGAA